MMNQNDRQLTLGAVSGPVFSRQRGDLNWLRRSYFAAPILVSLVLVGCGNSTEPTGTVSGRVTFGKDQPLNDALVMFFSQATGSAGTSPVNDKGEYSISTPLLLGDYIVTVSPPPTQGGGGDGPPPQPNENANIPKKYRIQSTTPLKTTLNEGPNEFDVKLEP